MTATLEHANLCVSDPHKTAAWMEKIFGWHIRWQGPALNGGYTVHVGSKSSYLALYSPAEELTPPPKTLFHQGRIEPSGRDRR
ncbi:glyoxalase/bleomycin resistance protein/dioxygenase superfamily protein [Tritonibacter scottomollicae]|uniref:Glyoxalase/bleomycin resistance protein/dioxygenase superfamily protein n=1 Tax=Tritonibacter scottomollicae TaxID=483013 RepID=A0A2T1AN55_TRISK|nr:glyoxalase/bleomycin resistance protein/dioxygenase superfamily protein [Tritonibacter scottomollicae]